MPPKPTTARKPLIGGRAAGGASAAAAGNKTAAAAKPAAGRPAAGKAPASARGGAVAGKPAAGKPAAAAAAGKSGPGVPAASRLPALDFEIPFSELELQEQVGAGGFGSVKRGQWRGTVVAIKELWVQEPEYVESLRTEVAVLLALRHPNVLLLMGACTVPPRLAMVTEFVAGGNLRHLLNDDARQPSWAQRVSFCADTARAMAYIHSKGLMHRDMKTYNLLVAEGPSGYTIKVCDFGLARIVPKKCDPKMTVKGTDYYMAPEVAAGKGYNNAADVFSFGLVMWEIISRELPDDLADEIKAGDPALRKKSVPAGCPVGLKDLACRCLDPDPSKRPDFAGIVALLEPIAESCGGGGGAGGGAGGGVGAGGGAGAGAGAGAGGAGAGGAASSIADPAAARFWSSKYGAGPKVPWSDFADALAAEAALPLRDIETMASHIKDPLERGMVTQATFSTFVQWFSGGFPAAVREAAALFKLPYFVGNVDQEGATAMLAGASEGTYLVRISASRQGCLSVAVVKGGAVRHSVVLRDAAGGLTIDNKRSFKDLPAFVEAHKFLFAVPFKKKK
jgi:hypothetical protein